MESLTINSRDFHRSSTSLLHSDVGDDEVFYEVGEHIPETMDTLNATGPSAMHQRKRSSVFELPTGMSLRAPAGSSMMSFAHEPTGILHEELLHHKPKAKTQYENNYHMEPPVKFQPERVTEIIDHVLKHHLTGKMYEPIECGLASKTISHEIKQKVKELNYKRYKIVSTVTIGEKKEHDVRFGSRCVWDTAWDNYASSYYDNPSLYAVGTVYAMYFE